MDGDEKTRDRETQVAEAILRLEREAYQHGLRSGARRRGDADLFVSKAGDHHEARREVMGLIDALDVAGVAERLREIADDLANVQAATFLDDRTVNGAIDRLREIAARLAGEEVQ